MEKTLEQVVNEWCKANGFNVNIVETDDCCYKPFDNTIEITLVGDVEMDTDFRDYLHFLSDDTYGYDTFVLSLLHELGHYKTLKYFSEDDITKYIFERDLLCGDIWDYFNLKIEKFASFWATQYIKSHRAEIDELIEDVYIAVANGRYKGVDL